MFHVLNLRVFFNSKAGSPFINEVLPVEKNGRLVDLIGEEILRKDRSLSKIDLGCHIKSATSLAGKSVMRMLELPASLFFAACKGDERILLTVVIMKPTPAPSVKKNPFAAMMPKAKEQTVRKAFTLECDVLDVEAFLIGYENAKSKEAYLSGFAKEAKPSIKEQLQAYVVAYLNVNNLGLREGSGGDDKAAANGLAALIEVVHFVHD